MGKVTNVFAGSLITGCLLLLALPLGERYYLAWFALVPLLVTTRGKGFLYGFLGGFVAVMFAAWLATKGWFYAHPTQIGSQAFVYTSLAIFGIPLGTAAGVWGDPSTSRLAPWWFAAIGVLFEAVLLVYLPEHLALTQYRQAPMLALAWLGGVWLVSYLLWFANFQIAALPWRSALCAALALSGLSLAGGLWRPTFPGTVQTFGIVQSAEFDQEQLSRFHLQASLRRPALVVWPEFAGIAFLRMGDMSGLAEFSDTTGSAPIVTSFEDEARPLAHNVAALFSHGRESALYAKRKLFGSENKMHAPGHTPLAVPYLGGQVGLNVCFDTCYPDIVRETARLPGVTVIVNPSIDPLAPSDFFSAMHASFVPFRAAESGVSIVKSDAYGYSEFVDPAGTIVKMVGPGDGYAVATLPTERRWTFYSFAGDWALWLCGALFSVPFLSEARARIRRGGN